jgi:hypothetical protein
MCQIVPFTLPCCRRVYVDISKVPGCPNDWPQSKCPGELCIQIGGYEAEHRDSGTCWRCQAKKAGITGHERQMMKPVIDKATIVDGLEELNVTERKAKIEEAGSCWYCGARNGCESCGAKFPDDHGITEQDTKISATGESSKKRQRDTGDRKGKGKEVNKRVKVESAGTTAPTPQQITYLNPNTRSGWANNYFQGTGYNHSGLVAPEIYNRTSAVDFASSTNPSLPPGVSSAMQFGYGHPTQQVDAVGRAPRQEASPSCVSSSLGIDPQLHGNLNSLGEDTVADQYGYGYNPATNEAVFHNGQLGWIYNNQFFPSIVQPPHIAQSLPQIQGDKDVISNGGCGSFSDDLENRSTAVKIETAEQPPESTMTGFDPGQRAMSQGRNNDNQAVEGVQRSMQTAEGHSGPGPGATTKADLPPVT